MATGQGSNPLTVLNSYHAGCKYELVEDGGPPHNKYFVFKVVILGVAYTGRGNSKKRAKHAAAASALRSIYNINLSLEMETSQSEGMVAFVPASAAAGGVGVENSGASPQENVNSGPSPQENVNSGKDTTVLSQLVLVVVKLTCVSIEKESIELAI